MNSTMIPLWHLKKGAGPQSAADQADARLVNYLGFPRLFMWYSGIIFKDELATKHPGVSVDAVSERDFFGTCCNGRALVRPTMASSGITSWVFQGPRVGFNVLMQV